MSSETQARYAIVEIWFDPATGESRRPISTRGGARFADSKKALERARYLRTYPTEASLYGLVSQITVIDTVAGQIVYDERIAVRASP